MKIGDELFCRLLSRTRGSGQPKLHARTIPKVVGANDPASRRALEAFYGAVFDQIVPVSSCEAAEMSKILENIYRCVNIALVNELKLLCQRMGLNIWEIVDAAKTKPFGYPGILSRARPGRSLHTHRSFYLSWKAREYDFSTRFIELAGEVNTNMPYEVVARVADYLSSQGIPSSTARLLVLGLAYKKNVDDCRESPSIKILKLLADRGFTLSYFDPYVKGHVSQRYGRLPGVELLELTDDAFLNTDATLILTDHDRFDYDRIVRLSKAVIDTRNATRNIANRKKIILA